MTGSESEFAELMKAVERTVPDDATPLLVCADWCDEHEAPNIAYALRWCAGRKVRPFFRADVKQRPWEWMRDQVTYVHLTGPQVRARSAARLPHAVFRVIKDGGPALIGYKTCTGAYSALSFALQFLRDLASVPDLPPTVVRRPEIRLACCPGCGLARNEVVERCPVCRPRSDA